MEFKIYFDNHYTKDWDINGFNNVICFLHLWNVFFMCLFWNFKYFLNLLPQNKHLESDICFLYSNYTIKCLHVFRHWNNSRCRYFLLWTKLLWEKSWHKLLFWFKKRIPFYTWKITIRLPSLGWEGRSNINKSYSGSTEYFS